jgi:F0F1-type ATP synthase assembly protein I
MGEDADTKQHQLESLNQQLEKAKKVVAPAKPVASGDAARAAIDFASATTVGIVLGYGLDRWLDTLPWGLLGGLLLGTAAGTKLMFEDEARRRRESENKTQTKD